MRFVNADTCVWINIFNYADNNPINLSDPNGKFPSLIVKGVKSIVSAVAAIADRVSPYITALGKAVSIGKKASINKGTISIDIGSANSDLLDCYDRLGLNVTSAIITGIVSTRYEGEIGQEFLFTDECMCFEIREHIHAYLFATGQRQLGANAIAKAYYMKQILEGKSDEEALQAIVNATTSTDLREADIMDPMQKLFFGYTNSIRPSRYEQALIDYKDAGIGESYY